MNQELSQVKFKRKQIFRLILAFIVIIVFLVLIYKISEEGVLYTQFKNADDMVLFGLFVVVVFPLTILSIIFSILFASYLRNRFPNRFQSNFKLFTFLLFLFIVFVFILNFIFIYTHQIVKESHRKKIIQNLGQVIQIEQIFEGDQKIVDDFSQNNIIIQTGEQGEIQYYYLDNVKKELSLIPSISGKRIYRYSLSPSGQKLVFGIGGGDKHIFIFDKTQNSSWKIGFNPKYNYIDYYNFFFDKGDRLIVNLRTSEGLPDFPIFTSIDLVNRRVEINPSQEDLFPIFDGNTNEENNSCINIQENSDTERIQEKIYLEDQGCIYIVYFSGLNKEELKFFDINSKETKKLFESSSPIDFLKKDNYIN